MFRCPALFCLASAWLLAGSAAPAAASELTLRTLSGEEVRAATVHMEGNSALRIQDTGVSRRLDLAEVISAEVVGVTPERGPDDDITVLLTDGSELHGKLLDGVEDELVLESADLGELRLALDLVAGAVFGDARGRLDPARLGPASEEDVVHRRGPVEGDLLSGTIMRAGRDGVVIDSDLGELQVSIDQVLALAVAAFEPEEGEWQPDLQLELKSGGRVSARLVSLSSGAVRVKTLFAAELEVPLERLLRIRFRSERFAWLSDLEPAAVEQSPFIGGDDEFLFPWRRDRSVTGGPLLSGGRSFGKGLGLHSRTRLSFDLDGRYSRLEAFMGVSDEVVELGTSGSVVFSIEVDGKQLYESPVLRSGNPPQRMPAVSLEGARRLVVEVDFADRGDIGDRAVLGEPLLISSEPK